MAAIDWDDVTDQAPELASISVPAQTAILLHVNTTLAVAGFGGEDAEKTFSARVYLAAHMATLLKRRGAGGFKSSQTAGPLSESFALLPLTQLGAYGTTSYGMLYAMICRSSAHRAGITF